MSFEQLPDGFVAEAPAPPTVSDRKRAANKANAARSTGPKTAEGKARSRLNATKHGLCAEVVAVPGDDPAAAARRLSEWSSALNPGGDPVVGYLTEHAVRASIRLDRCHRASEARTARRVREARESRHQARMTEVEEASRRLVEAPDAAGRVLRSTSEGCEFLIGELKRIKLPLIPDPPLWDHDDAMRLLQLKGLATAARGEGPSPLGLVVLVLAEYRAVVEKLRANERPQDIPWTRRYPSEAAHQAAIDGLPELSRKALAARDEVGRAIDAEIAHLEALRADRLTVEEADAAEAPERALFDPSDEARLLHRYEQDTHRVLLRTLGTIRSSGQVGVKSAEAVATKEVNEKPSLPENRAARRRAARNEPRPSPPGDRPGAGRRAIRAAKDAADVAIVPSGPGKDR